METFKFFQKKNPKDKSLSLDFVDSSGQNCFHYAVGRNRLDFVKYLIHEHPKSNNLNINLKTIESGESPIFFALGKLKHNQADKIKMVRLLLESDKLNVSLLNNEKKACYEAYNDLFGFDEASSIVEKKHLKGEENNVSSRLFYRDFSKQ